MNSFIIQTYARGMDVVEVQEIGDCVETPRGHWEAVEVNTVGHGHGKNIPGHMKGSKGSFVIRWSKPVAGHDEEPHYYCHAQHPHNGTPAERLKAWDAAKNRAAHLNEIQRVPYATNTLWDAEDMEDLRAEAPPPNYPVVPVGADGLCKCDCGTSCPLGRTGMAERCTKEELEKHYARGQWQHSMPYAPEEPANQSSAAPAPEGKWEAVPLLGHVTGEDSPPKHVIHCVPIGWAVRWSIMDNDGIYLYSNYYTSGEDQNEPGMDWCKKSARIKAAELNGTALETEFVPPTAVRKSFPLNIVHNFSEVHIGNEIVMAPKAGYWEVVPEIEEYRGGKRCIGARVRWSIPDAQGRYLWIRHYLTDLRDGDPSAEWCKNAAERNAQQLTRDLKGQRITNSLR